MRMRWNRHVSPPDDPPDVDSWITATEGTPLAEATLDEVLRYAATYKDPEDSEAVRIGVRLTPPGWRAIMRMIAREYRVSYSRLAYYALGHGIAVLDEQEAISALRAAYNTTSSQAMEKGDPSALARLNVVATYDFQRSQSFRTTLIASKETDARITDLAMICGISTNRLAVLVTLVSLITLGDRRKYQDGLREEVNAFYEFALWRRQVLQIGDGSHPKKSRLNGELR